MHLCHYKVKLLFCSNYATICFKTEFWLDSECKQFIWISVCFKDNRFAIFTGLSQWIILSSQIEVKLTIKYNIILKDGISLLAYYEILDTPTFFKTETWLHSSQQPFPIRSQVHCARLCRGHQSLFSLVWLQHNANIWNFTSALTRSRYC